MIEKDNIAADGNVIMEWGELKKTKKKTPSAYNTLPYYYPTEQVDIVRKMKRKRRRRKK